MQHRFQALNARYTALFATLKATDDTQQVFDLITQLEALNRLMIAALRAGA